jgi:hypothetical protein
METDKECFRLMKDESLIPKGDYCYDAKGNCPYWSLRKDLPKQENGYCSFLEKSDYDINEKQGKIHWKSNNEEDTITEPHEIPIGLLFDQCKECDINMWTEEELDEQNKDNIL